MNKTTYLTCLNSHGITTGNTGSVLGLYDFTGYDSKIIFNQILSNTGNHYVNGLIYTDTLPLVSLNQAPASGFFSSNHCYEFGNTMTGDFSIFLDLNYNGCSRTTTGTDYILLSNIKNESGLNSGFFLGINESNRLFLRTSGISKTISKELKSKNLVFLSNSDNTYLNFGIYDVNDHSFYNQSIKLDSPFPNNKPLYLGGFLNNFSSSFTGFSGQINNAAFFDSPINLDTVSGCVDCLFVSGFNIVTGTSILNIPVISGYVTGATLTTGITGYVPTSGIITNANGSPISIYSLSGVVGITSTTLYSNIITGSVPVTVTGNIITNYLYNQSLISQYNSFNIEVSNQLVSGDYVELYTYGIFNSKIGNSITNFEWPNSALNIQLIGNGLLETTGLDYLVNNNFISGYDPTDYIDFDLVSGQKIITSYSGLWSRSKIALSGGGFFPSKSQYIESGSGAVVITGINGTGLTSNTDLYLNGQKLVSGIQYSIVPSGLLNLFILSGTGLPDFYADSIRNITGGLPTGIANIHDSELAFYPQEDSPSRYFFQITGNQSVLNNITGFSEQVWINGIRQALGRGYIKDFACNLSSGIFSFNDYPFNFYNNDGTYFNII